jgi:DNA-binding SARP family transcriptional activator
MTTVRLLGPIEADAPLPGGKPKALLARLLLDSGRVVSTDALVEALWESPPPSAAKVLQAHVSALRKALGPEAIETRAGGYVLRSGPSDLARFEELAERARLEDDPARRLQSLRDALALWRGEPLAEFRREPFARPAAARLAEMHLDVLTRRIDAELELGRHERLLPELARLVEEEPLREQLRRRLMVALYRAGRQVEALAVYREGRRLLVEELGIEPGPDLQQLERAILRHDPALENTAARRAERRGPVLCIGVQPVGLLGPLGRELVLVELAADAATLPAAAAKLERLPADQPSARTACFTSAEPVADVVRLARDQEAELIVTGEVSPALLAAAPCDVAILAEPAPFEADGPVLVPFGGGRDEWPALELGAALARAHGIDLRLLGVEATGERRDASRMLAAASLSLQRFAGIAAQPVVVPGGPEGVLAQDGALIVAALGGEQDAARRRLLAESRVPVLLVQGGLRPGALAPDRTLTRFSWTAAPDDASSVAASTSG